MSDGPHKSLPMTRGWRRVAERGDKRAYSIAEIGDAIVLALEQDCRVEMSPEFIAALRRVAEERSLFSDGATRFESLRPFAGPGIGRVVLDNVGPLSDAEISGLSLLRESVKVALQDRALRGSRQVEEHYLREATAPRANNVRGRLEDGVAVADLEVLVERLLNADPAGIPRALAKQAALDDGVKLP